MDKGKGVRRCRRLKLRGRTMPSRCVSFAQTMRLPSMKVAAFLLFLMFFYDIFMVFISPLGEPILRPSSATLSRAPTLPSTNPSSHHPLSHPSTHRPINPHSLTLFQNTCMPHTSAHHHAAHHTTKGCPPQSIQQAPLRAVFHSSVMLEVATAGQPSASLDASGVCQRTEGERMPMLMIIPRYTPLPGGLHAGTSVDYAMLGLGDIVRLQLALAAL